MCGQWGLMIAHMRAPSHSLSAWSGPCAGAPQPWPVLALIWTLPLGSLHRSGESRGDISPDMPHSQPMCTGAHEGMQPYTPVEVCRSSTAGEASLKLCSELYEGLSQYNNRCVSCMVHSSKPNRHLRMIIARGSTAHLTWLCRTHAWTSWKLIFIRS